MCHLIHNKIHGTVNPIIYGGKKVNMKYLEKNICYKTDLLILQKVFAKAVNGFFFFFSLQE